MSAIFKREFASYFSSAVGYVVTAAFMMFSGIYFYFYCLYSGTSNMYNVFENMFLIVMFIIPLITMRLFAEEKKHKTDQALLTSPVSIASIVTAKYFSAMVILLICLSSYIVEGVILSFIAQPDWSVIIGNIIGMFLLGSAFTSIGILISSMTESVIVAAVFSFAVNIVISMADTVSAAVNNSVIKNIVDALSFRARYDNFSLGLISLSDIVFFVTVTFLFLFLTDRVIERSRWA